MKAVYIVHAVILAIAIAITAAVLLLVIKSEAEGGDGVSIRRGQLPENVSPGRTVAP